MIATSRFRRLTLRILEQPTTSFHEHRVLRLLAAHAEGLGLGVAQDRWGNLHVRHPRAARRPRWMLVAHTDHPGFVIVAAAGCAALARWFGRVEPEYFVGAPVRIHGGANSAARPLGASVDRRGGVRGRVSAVRMGGARGRVRWVHLRTDEPVAVGAIGGWDLPAAQARGDRLHTRAADDLVGCALLAGLLEGLVRSGSRAPVEVVYTRAEEAGLLGATALAGSGCVSPEVAILSLETSRAHSAARIGGGPVLRIGDRMSIFDPALARFLHQTAEDLRTRAPGFRYQRALMDGGTCEASSFAAYGYRTAAIAIPLGNYHNMGPRRVACEVVSLSDLEGALRFLEALVSRARPRGGWPPASDRPALSAGLRPLEGHLRRTIAGPLEPWKD